MYRRVKRGFSFRARLTNIFFVVGLGLFLVICAIAQRADETDKLRKQRWVLFEFARKGAADFSIGFGSQPIKQSRNRLANLGDDRESFATLVENTTKKVPELALNSICRDKPEFISVVVKTRNVLTHMQGNKKLPLEVASYLSLFLTYKLIVLYCIHACISMGLPTDNLATMLANNAMARMACRPLPAI